MRDGSLFSGAALLIRLPLLLIYVGLPLLLVGASVCWSTRRSVRVVAVDEPARRARHGRLMGSGVGAVVGVALTLSGQALLAPAAVALGYLAGLLATELRAAPVPDGPVRVASLRARSGNRYLPRLLGPTAAGLAVLAAVAPVAFALLPQLPDEHILGSETGYQYRATIAAPAWPPVTLSGPLAVVAVLALVVGAMLIRRVALRPISDTAPAVDEQVRRNIARGIGGAVLGTELLVLAALTILGSEGLDAPRQAGAAYVGSRVMLAAGLVLAALALVAWIVTGWWRRVPTSLPPNGATT